MQTHKAHIVGIWALRTHKEASKVDSLKPRKYIHLGLVDWKLLGAVLSLQTDPLLTYCIISTYDECKAHLAREEGEDVSVVRCGEKVLPGSESGHPPAKVAAPPPGI